MRDKLITREDVHSAYTTVTICEYKNYIMFFVHNMNVSRDYSICEFRIVNNATEVNYTWLIIRINRKHFCENYHIFTYYFNVVLVKCKENV